MLKIKNWNKWQTFRKDRGAPPWIKLHRCLLSDQNWALLSDADKGQLISMWLIAADKNGEIPENPKTLRKVCGMDDDPNISKFIELGFLKGRSGCHDDVSVTPTCRQHDAPEQSRAEQSRAEHIKKSRKLDSVGVSKKPKKAPADRNPEVREVIDHFCSRYLDYVGTGYVVSWAKDASIIKRLLKDIGRADLFSLIDNFFAIADDDKFISQTGRDIGVFSSQVNKLNATKRRERCYTDLTQEQR